jgi:hypothetical protein
LRLILLLNGRFVALWVAEEWFGGDTLVLMVAVAAAWLADLSGGAPSNCVWYARGSGS